MWCCISSLMLDALMYRWVVCVIVLSFPGFHHVQIVIWRKHEKRTKYHQNVCPISSVFLSSCKIHHNTPNYLKGGGLIKYTYQQCLVRFHYYWYVFTPWLILMPKGKKKIQSAFFKVLNNSFFKYRYVRDTFLFGRSDKWYDPFSNSNNLFYTDMYSSLFLKAGNLSLKNFELGGRLLFFSTFR